MEKVFVLITQWSVDYECGSDCGVYATKELAQTDMKIDYESMRKEFTDWEEYSISDDCASMQEAGDYSRNHCDWQIKEMPIHHVVK